MASYRKMDKHRMAMLNKQNIMQCISDNAPISRSDIANLVGMSLPAVMEITDRLVEHGMLDVRLDEGIRVGKKPEMLSVCGQHFRFVGVDVGRTTIRILLVGLDQEIISSVKYETEDVNHEYAFVKRICDKINYLIERSGVARETIMGVCVAMPGLIERDTGKVIFSPNFGWENIPLQEWMNDILEYEVIVENANRVQASWEVFRNPANKALTVLCIGLGYGIGSGLLQSGELYYGASGTSGEIGHVPVCPDGGARCTCGNYGCLEAMASGAALARRAEAIIGSGSSQLMTSMASRDKHKIEAKIVFDAAKAGDKVALEVIDETAKYIAIALATAINVLDPDRIYLCGGMMKNGDDFLERIKHYTKLRQMHNAGHKVLILQGDADEWNVARGAARVVPYYSWKHEALSFMR